MPIRAVRKEDHDAIWQILEPAIRAGDTYPLPRDMDKAEAIPHWTGPDLEAFVAEKDGRIIGTYYLRANQAGGGAHVANCGYMTADDARGRGVARSTCEHSLLHARERRFRAMQFNFVISTNEQAIRLWESLGFITSVVSRSPSTTPKSATRMLLLCFVRSDSFRQLVEGDLGNARYWYRQAGRSQAFGDLAAEWTAIAATLLAS